MVVEDRHRGVEAGMKAVAVPLAMAPMRTSAPVVVVFILPLCLVRGCGYVYVCWDRVVEVGKGGRRVAAGLSFGIEIQSQQRP